MQFLLKRTKKFDAEIPVSGFRVENMYFSQDFQLSRRIKSSISGQSWSDTVGTAKVPVPVSPILIRPVVYPANQYPVHLIRSKIRAKIGSVNVKER